MKMAIIGYGYWGPNLVRNFSRIEGIEVKVICDMNPRIAQTIHSLYPQTQFLSDWKEAVNRNDIDAVAIATPVSSHYEIAKEALAAGKHVFVEKPMTLHSHESEELIEIAERSNLVLMVDHTFLFTGAVKKIEEILKEGMLGDILYFDSTRVNLGRFQNDMNVIWDLAPHDLSIMLYLLKDKVSAISATGMNHINGFEDIAYISVHFENKIIAHFSVNWLSPVKIRSILIGGNKRMLVWNDILADDKIKVYNKGVEVKNTEGVRKLLISYRSGDMWAPKIDPTEALYLEAKYFMECISENKTPHNDGHAGLEVVKILEACDRSLQLKGQIIEIEPVFS